MATLTNQAYSQMVKEASPNSKSARCILQAFLIGGGICTLGHGLTNLYLYLGAPQEAAAPAASITLVFLASLLTGLNIYDKLATFGGGGTLVPITGFSNSVTAAALEYKSEGYIMGLGAKMFTIAGPVIVYGVAAGILYGLILYLFRLY